MASEQDEYLSRIITSSRKIKSAIEKANEQIELLDDSLSAANVGVECWNEEESIDLGYNPSDEIDPNVYCYDLGYARADSGTYCLSVKCYIDKGDDPILPDWQVHWIKPLKSCSRDIRIKSLKCIPTLLKELAEKIEFRASEIYEAYEAVEQINKSFRSS